MVRSSLMGMAQIFVVPPIWIRTPCAGRTTRRRCPRCRRHVFQNSLFVTVFVVAGTVVTGSICAYSFARIRWKGRGLLFSLIISSMMLPPAVTLIPLFLQWNALKLTNSFVPLIAPAWFGGGAYYIFLLRQFYMGIPRELDESARIDGAGHFTIYSRIILPLTKPAMIVVGLFAFMNCWNDFLHPLVYLNDTNQYTVALGLQLFIGSYRTDWHLLMAAACVAILPVIAVFLIGQRYFIEGITLTESRGNTPDGRGRSPCPPVERSASACIFEAIRSTRTSTPCGPKAPFSLFFRDAADEAPEED